MKKVTDDHETRIGLLSLTSMIVFHYYPFPENHPKFAGGKESAR